MAWHVHFGGDKLSAISDETYAHIRAQLLSAAETGKLAVVVLETSTERFELLWTAGTPIYFSYFDENADSGD